MTTATNTGGADTTPPGSPGPPKTPRATTRLGDRTFAGAARGAGILILLVLAGVAGFLLIEAWPALVAAPEELPGGEGFVAYVAPLALGTVTAAIIALLLATPLAVGIALFISHYAPRRLANALGYLVDLLAAVPSIIYGFWGLAVLAPLMTPVGQWLESTLGFLPFFAGPASATGRTTLTVGVVLAVMILPIVSGVTREVFLQTPRLHQEAALALGATRWEVIRMTVLPFGRSGIISASMLGLGRALGETMAVAIVLSASGVLTVNLISSSNAGTIAAAIALDFPEASGVHVNALVAAGLVLFIITMAVNMFARWIVSRRSAFAGAN